MIIGKIDYINLLPFLVFLKKRLSLQEKAALNFYKGSPKHINNLFKKRRVEAAVISSIVSKKYRCTDFGIVAFKRVDSVLVCPGEAKEDKESDTSNTLAKILDIKGEVLIGDKALIQKNRKCIDLANEWYKRYRMPFVFARFCYQKNGKKYEKLADIFLKSSIKIPNYILENYSKRSGLSKKDILNYLKLINYHIGYREKRALKKFFKLSKRLK